MTIIYKPKTETIITCNHLKPRILWRNIGDITKPLVVCDSCNSRLPDSDPVAQYWINRALQEELYAA